MKRLVSLHYPWITVNILLFSGYAIFDVASFFWPSGESNVWILFLYFITLAVNLLIVYGLIRKTARILYLVVLVSFLMLLHLLIFILHPLGIEVAYLGPSRSFYFLFISVMAGVVAETRIGHAVLLFNLVMVCVHVINVVYFTRKKVVALFTHSLLKSNEEQG